MNKRGIDAVYWRGIPGDDGRIRVELPDPKQIEIYRRWTPAERLAASSGAASFVRERLRAHLAWEHPDWSASQLRIAVARRILGEPSRDPSVPD